MTRSRPPPAEPACWVPTTPGALADWRLRRRSDVRWPELTATRQPSRTDRPCFRPMAPAHPGLTPRKMQCAPARIIITIRLMGRAMPRRMALRGQRRLGIRAATARAGSTSRAKREEPEPAGAAAAPGPSRRCWRWREGPERYWLRGLAVGLTQVELVEARGGAAAGEVDGARRLILDDEVVAVQRHERGREHRPHELPHGCA